MSPIRLRDTWGLKDQSILEIEVEGDADWWAKPDPDSNPVSQHE
jgi:bifunctional DNA-binding transcriptional regulator/antitoxin component of YhaV-PrlF toxin-antitoxin module